MDTTAITLNNNSSATLSKPTRLSRAALLELQRRQNEEHDEWLSGGGLGIGVAAHIAAERNDGSLEPTLGYSNEIKTAYRAQSAFGTGKTLLWERRGSSKAKSAGSETRVRNVVVCTYDPSSSHAVSSPHLPITNTFSPPPYPTARPSSPSLSTTQSRASNTSHLSRFSQHTHHQPSKISKSIYKMNRGPRLPPLEAFTFSGIMASIGPDVNQDLERIAEICARSRYSLSNQYEVHMPPHGEGYVHPSAAGWERPGSTGGHGGGQTGGRMGYGSGGVMGDGVGVGRMATASEGTVPPNTRTGRRRKSKAFETLETIYSSSRSSDSQSARQKPAKDLADQVLRGRRKATKRRGQHHGNADGDLGAADADNEASVVNGRGKGARRERREERQREKRYHSDSFAALVIDTAQSGQGGMAQSQAGQSLASDPAKPRTSGTLDREEVMASLAVQMPELETGQRKGYEVQVHQAVPQEDRYGNASVWPSLSSWLPWSRSLHQDGAETPDAEGSLRSLLQKARSPEPEYSVPQKGGIQQ